MRKVAQVREVVDLIIRDVEDSKLVVVLQTRYLGQRIVRDVELLEVF